MSIEISHAKTAIRKIRGRTLIRCICMCGAHFDVRDDALCVCCPACGECDEMSWMRRCWERDEEPQAQEQRT